MLHHPLRLEAFLLSTIQKKTDSRGLSRNAPSAPLESFLQLNWSPKFHPTQKRCAEYSQPIAALRFIIAIRHQRGWCARLSIRQGARQTSTRRGISGRIAGPNRIRRARFGADNEGVRSHGAQLPVLSSKRTLAQLKIQDWGRAVALKDTAATKKEWSPPHHPHPHHHHQQQIQIRMLLLLPTCETDLRQEENMHLRSAQQTNKVGRIDNLRVMLLLTQHAGAKCNSFYFIFFGPHFSTTDSAHGSAVAQSGQVRQVTRRSSESSFQRCGNVTTDTTQITERLKFPSLFSPEPHW